MTSTLLQCVLCLAAWLPGCVASFTVIVALKPGHTAAAASARQLSLLVLLFHGHASFIVRRPLRSGLLQPVLSSVLYNVLKGNREAVISLGDPKIVFLPLPLLPVVVAAMRNPARTNWPFCAHQQHGPS